MKKDPRVDAYIEKSAEFARPILKTLRAVIHQGAPDVSETIRWGMPSFDVAGGPLCQMAAFKAHCRFMFWNSAELSPEKNGMDLFGHIASTKDLPSKSELTAFVKKAARAKVNRATKKKMAVSANGAPAKKVKPVPKTPADFSDALAKNKKAAAAFEKFSPSHKREYIEWITEAKREETRAKRVAKAIDQIASGKSLNWKYM